MRKLEPHYVDISKCVKHLGQTEDGVNDEVRISVKHATSHTNRPNRHVRKGRGTHHLFTRSSLGIDTMTRDLNPV